MMAGEIDEPFSVSFQADSIHSGSISFGRFESESLSWERRSSFSHNRYLEEVEKCSKPGSVTEKKAYFEVFFKKKALQSQSSSEYQNGSKYQISENDASENMGYRKEFEHLNEDSHYANFDDSPEDSQCHGEGDVTECEREDPRVVSSESMVEPSLNSADILKNSIADDAKPEETHQTESRCDKSPSVDYELGIEVKGNPTDDAAKIYDLSKAIDPSPKSAAAGEVDNLSLEHWQEPSLKRTAAETKLTKPKVKSQVNVAHVKRNISGDASKDHAKNPGRKERESPQRTSAEKQSSKSASPATRSVHRNPKLEDSESQKVKLINEKKSCGVKELRGKKVGESQASVPNKVEPRGCQTVNRLKQTVNSTKPYVRPNSAAFDFKSNERAERRKEFYMKLEYKMHAKEAELNKFHARTQENTEAEIKQFRKSLNFKATPMPSFYHAAAPPGSCGNKAVSSDNKSPNQVRNKSMSPGSGATAILPSHSKAGNEQAVCTGESVKTRYPPETSGVTDYPTVEPSKAGVIFPTSSIDRNRPTEAVIKNDVNGKKERGKKDTDLQKNRVSEDCKATRSHRVEGKQKVGARRSSNEMVRKNVKGVGVGVESSSGMGHLAVGVAS